ncbi:P-loop containing nucleoside triphosphate hydrolase protein [Phlyctochytrium arcticum]|nr:P-loop containing nucleoside triphosphate hydrolase protein [Phlyctochytrium arcticum]
MDKKIQYPRNICEPPISDEWTREISLPTQKGDDGASMLLDTLNEQSCRVQAPAGHGKSHLINAVGNHCKSKGISVSILAPTNAAADNISGKTIHKGLSVFGGVSHTKTRNRSDVIIIDEISQIPSYLWNIIYSYKKMGSRFLLFGDGHQLPPVEPWEDTLSSEYLESCLVKTIADGNLVHLPINHRFVNDPSNAMQDICDKILSGDSLDCTIVNADTMMDIKLNIAFTHRMCHHVNDLHMKNDLTYAVKNSKRRFHCPRIAQDPKTQDCVLIKGSPLIARKAMRKQGILKGTRWTVSRWDDKEVMCINQKDYKKWCTVPRGTFQKHFLSGFCTTVHEAQGQTFNQPFVIHEKEKNDN